MPILKIGRTYNLVALKNQNGHKLNTINYSDPSALFQSKIIFMYLRILNWLHEIISDILISGI